MTTRRRTVARRTATTSRRRRPIRLHEAVIRDYAKLAAWPNVEGVAVGWKERGGRVTSLVSVKIHVREKKTELRDEERLPKTTIILLPVGGGMYESRRVHTDVVWHAPAKFCARPEDFLNPLLGGALLLCTGSKVGTFGCVVRDASGRRFALTAGHVVRQVPGEVIRGMAILQPPTEPPDLPPGESTRMGKTSGGFFGNGPNGFVDFALIELRDGRTASGTALDGMPLVGPIVPWGVVNTSQITVTKFGARTCRTDAVFVGPAKPMVIDGVAVNGVYEFKGLSGRLFGEEGDSGALVVSTSPEHPGIVGVLFAITDVSPDAPGGKGYVFPFERLVGLTPA